MKLIITLIVSTMLILSRCDINGGGGNNEPKGPVILNGSYESTSQDTFFTTWCLNFRTPRTIHITTGKDYLIFDSLRFAGYNSEIGDYRGYTWIKCYFVILKDNHEHFIEFEKITINIMHAEIGYWGVMRFKYTTSDTSSTEFEEERESYLFELKRLGD